MDYQAFEHFLRIAELGSMSKAAIELRRSQPSLSRQIALLEHRVGAKLFTRTSNGVVLTEAGRLLADCAGPILSELAALVDRVGERAAGRLSVGAPRSWQSICTAKFVTTFMTQQPNVALKLSEAVSSALREQMLSGLLDLSIVPFENEPPKGYSHTPLVREPLILIAQKDHPLPAAGVPLAEMNGLRLVLPPKPNIVRTRVEHAMARRGLAFKTVAEIDTLSLALELVSSGLGITCAPSCALYGKYALESERFCWAPVQGLSVTWALCENDAHAHSPAVRHGRRLLIETVNEAVQSGHWFGAELASPNESLVPGASLASQMTSIA